MSSVDLVCQSLKQRGHSYVKLLHGVPNIEFSPLILVADCKNQPPSPGTNFQLTVIFLMPAITSLNQIKTFELHNLLKSVKEQRHQILASVKHEVEEFLNLPGDKLNDFIFKTQFGYLDMDGRLLLMDVSSNFPDELKTSVT